MAILSRKHYYFAPLLTIFSLYQSGHANFGISLFHEANRVKSASCSFELDSPLDCDCACAAGLWFLYDSCGDTKTLVGNNHYCDRILEGSSFPISKAVQILGSHEELAVLRPDGKVLTLTQASAKGTRVNEDVLLVTGSDWTLIDSFGGKICLASGNANSYCFFSSKEVKHFRSGNEKTAWIIDRVEPGCEDKVVFMNSVKCIPIPDDNTVDICKGQEESSHHHSRLVKRQVNGGDAGAATTVPTPAGGGGAVPAPTDPIGVGAPSDDGNSAFFKDIMAEDEDYLIATANKTENDNAKSVVSIEKGIIDYMDFHLTKELGLSGYSGLSALGGMSDKINQPLSSQTEGDKKQSKEGEAAGGPIALDSAGVDNDVFVDAEQLERQLLANLLNVTYPNPVYEFLDLSKKIMQKTCPPHYVRAEFLNLAVATFIRMQQLEFKFPEDSFKPSGFRRVLNALRACEANATQFNFTGEDCNGKVSGKYILYGQNLEMTISSQYADFERDPIVETVWKVFFNAHSYCYPFFTHSLDHHRFTTWMIPLFQNEMNDLWLKGKTTNNSLSGLFGNQIVVQGNLGYCAVSSRLISQYPWDLPRPIKVSGDGNSTAGGTQGAGSTPPPASPGVAQTGGNRTGAGGSGPPTRRKREISGKDAWETCSDSTKPILCPTHVKSIIASNGITII